MTAPTLETPESPGSTPPPADPPTGPGGERPPHIPRRRWLTLLVVVLLIAIPAGYLVQCAVVSRAAGIDSQRKAAATNIAYGRPSKVQQRIFDTPVPATARRTAFYEADAWRKSTLYLQFRTSRAGLREFLAGAGAGRRTLRPGHGAIRPDQAERVGWDLSHTGHRWSGVSWRQPGPRPDLQITVDTRYPSRPRVYVVSRSEF